MNFVHLGDLKVLKEAPSKPQPINLDKVAFIHTWNNNAYHKIYFTMISGNDVEWDFVKKEDFEVYYERILSLINSTDLSKMTKL
jgi:hypothetical protein